MSTVNPMIVKQLAVYTLTAMKLRDNATYHNMKYCKSVCYKTEM